MDKEALNIMKGNEHPEEWQQPPVDKAAQEKIVDILYEIIGGDSEFNKEGGQHPMADFCDEEAEKILQGLTELGYCKPPEGQPPLLSDRKIREIISEWEPFTVASAPQFGITKNVAQAQREADIKWYGGER